MYHTSDVLGRRVPRVSFALVDGPGQTPHVLERDAQSHDGGSYKGFKRSDRRELVRGLSGPGFRCRWHNERLRIVSTECLPDDIIPQSLVHEK